jgi:hypothetical protein
MSKSRIIAAYFDRDSWEFTLTADNSESDVLDLTKYVGFGLKSDALLAVAVCECGRSIWFPEM